MDEDPRLAQARQAVRESRFADAFALYDALLGDGSEPAEVLLDYGRAKYREYDDLQGAAALFERAAAARPDWPEALLWLGDLQSLGYRAGYAAAADTYRRAAALDPADPDPWIGLGMLHRAPGSPVAPADAVEAFRTAVRLAPGRADARKDLGVALLHAGDAGAARGELAAAADLLEAAGAQREARGVRALLARAAAGEPVAGAAYSLDSPRYRWPD